MKKPLAIAACTLALVTAACGNKNTTVTTTTTTEPVATVTTTSATPSGTATVTKSTTTKTSTSTKTSATTKTTTSSVTTHSATTTASSTPTATASATSTATTTGTATAVKKTTAKSSSTATYSPSGAKMGTGNSVVPTTLTIGSLKLSTGAIPKYAQAEAVKVTKVSNTMTIIAVQNPTGKTTVFPLVKIQQLPTAATTDAAIKAVCKTQLGATNVVLDKTAAGNVCTRGDTKSGVKEMHWYQIKGHTYIMLTIEPLGTATSQDQLFSNVVVALDKNLKAAA